VPHGTGIVERQFFVLSGYLSLLFRHSKNSLPEVIKERS
jgi:hypothetical protein